MNVSYPFNNHRPQFNDISGEGEINQADQCNEENPEKNPKCQVDFDQDFFATDGDGDTVTYKIIPPSLIFGIRDEKNLSSLFYRGVGISQDSSINLLIQV